MSLPIRGFHMSGHQHHHRLHASPSPPGLLHHISLPVRSLHRTRPPSVSFRPHLPRPPQSLPSPLPKKRSDHEAAADFGELGAGGAVADDTTEAEDQLEYGGGGVYTPSVGAGLPALLRAGRAGPAGDPVFFLLTAVAVTTSVAFSGMVAVAIPTMLAMRRAANSFTMLADAALEELPSTIAAIRLSGMEVTDLTLGLSDLSHEIADGVNKSAKVAQAVEAGMGQMQDIAMSMVKERASLRTIPTAGLDNKSHKSSRQQRRRERGLVQLVSASSPSHQVLGSKPSLYRISTGTRFACPQDPNYDIRVTTKGGHVSVPATGVTAEALKPDVLT